MCSIGRLFVYDVYGEQTLKLAWLCYTNGYDPDEIEVILKFLEEEGLL